MSGKYALGILVFTILVTIAVVVTYLYFKSRQEKSSAFQTLTPSQSSQPPTYTMSKATPLSEPEPDTTFCIGITDNNTYGERSIISTGSNCSKDGWTLVDTFKAYSQSNPNVTPWCTGSRVYDGEAMYKMIPQKDCGGDGWTHENLFYLPNKNQNSERICVATDDNMLYKVSKNKCPLATFAKPKLIKTWTPI